MLLGCKKNDFINILISLLKTIKQKENHQETLFTETRIKHTFLFLLNWKTFFGLDVYPAFGAFAETFHLFSKHNPVSRNKGLFWNIESKHTV